MKFNVGKLKAIAVPMSPESLEALRFRAENAYWLRLSFDIAVKIRKILCCKEISKEELANLLALSLSQVEEYISGKYSFDLKTIVKLQMVLGEPIIGIHNLDKAPDQFEDPCERVESIVPNQSVNQMDVFDYENIKINDMKFNLEKLKAIAHPMTPEEKADLEYQIDNADWLRMSAIIALKIRKILRLKGMSQAELASSMDITPDQVSKLLSGKVNIDLKTIAKLQSVLKETIIEIDLFCKSLESEKQEDESKNEDIEQLPSSEVPASEETDSQLDKYSGILYEGYLHD